MHRNNPYQKIYHLGQLIREDGGVSALCFKRPKPINLKKSLWTNRREAVTCKKCLAILAMHPHEIAREFFPDATEEFLEFIIWEKTGYPHFWNIPADGKTPVECFRKQLAKAKANVA